MHMSLFDTEGLTRVNLGSLEVHTDKYESSNRNPAWKHIPRKSILELRVQNF